MWVKEVFAIEEGGKKKEQAVGATPEIKLPLNGHVLHEVIQVMCKTVHDNIMAAIFTISMTFFLFTFRNVCIISNSFFLFNIYRTYSNKRRGYSIFLHLKCGAY